MAQRKKPDSKNTRSWISPQGDPVVHVFESLRSQSIQQMVFRAPKKLSVDISIGAFVEALLEVLFSDQKYINPRDVYRHASLVHDFWKSQPRIWDRRKDAFERTAAEDLPLSDFALASREWITGLMMTRTHPLLVSFALNTLELMESFIEGQYIGEDEQEKYSIKLESMFGDKAYDILQLTITDVAQFKRDVTRYGVGGMILLAQVPEGGTVKLQNRELTLREGSTFLCKVERCHLSSSFQEYNTLYAVDPGIGKYDISSFFFPIEVPLTGNPWLDRANDLGEYILKDVSESDRLFRYSEIPGPTMRLPAHWILGSYEWLLGDSPPQWCPAPEWEVKGTLGNL